MAMFGTKSVLDMTSEEFEAWRAAIDRQREYERRFNEGTTQALASAKLKIAFFGATAE